MSPIYPLLVELTDADTSSVVGAKAANLRQVRQTGLPTPDGVVIPDPVFQRHLERAGVRSLVSQLHAGLEVMPIGELEIAGARIRDRIDAMSLEPELGRTLWRTWSVRWPGRVLVVRSSAVGEDSANASFAGQLESFLGIGDGSSLETAVKATWSSLFSLPALTYARRCRLKPEHMGVIVQPQVDAVLSGVLFTRDPTGQRPGVMLMEYCRGLGDALVGGRLTPSRVRVDRENLEVVLEHHEASTPGLDHETTRLLGEIASMGLALEALDGAPRDIEWCIDREARPVLVQSRPITTHEPVGTHWTNANIAENFPDPVSPFLFSFVKPGYRAYFKNLGLGFGLSPRRLEAMSEPLDNIVGLQGGRLYYNLSNIHRLLRLMPAGERLVKYFNLFVGAHETPAVRPIGLGRWARIFETTRIVGSISWRYLFIKRRIRRFESRVDAFAAGTRPRELEGMSAASLGERLDGFLRIRLSQWNDAALADTAAMVCYGLLKALLHKQLPDADQHVLHNDLLKGLPGLASAAPVAKLFELAAIVKRDPPLRAFFLDADADELADALEEGRLAGFERELDHYLEHWGFRSSGELMLSVPTPEEDPRGTLRLLKAYMSAQVESPERLIATQREARLVATARVAAALSPLRWWRHVPMLSRAGRFRVLLHATQGAIRLRERARMKQALLYTRLRHIVLQLGDRLVAARRLEKREDIFFLTTDEVRGLTVDAGSRPELAAPIESRRGMHEAAFSLTPPDSLVLAPGEQWSPNEPTPSDPGGAGEQTLTGIGACGGSVTGDVVVVREGANAHRVEAGQILVTRQSDPGWAAVFFLVRGLVVERGGMLSHGAIIAREYGIPAVVGVRDATRLIGDGDYIRVDGDKGLVELGIERGV